MWGITVNSYTPTTNRRVVVCSNESLLVILYGLVWIFVNVIYSLCSNVIVVNVILVIQEFILSSLRGCFFSHFFTLQKKFLLLSHWSEELNIERSNCLHPMWKDYWTSWKWNSLEKAMGTKNSSITCFMSFDEHLYRTSVHSIPGHGCRWLAKIFRS